MTTKSLLQPRFRTLRAVAFGLSISFSAPVFADNLPEVQRLIKQGQHAQALEKVESYLSSRPKDAQGRFLKGLIFTEMNRSADAISVFTKLSEDYPELPEPYNNLAVLYAQQKQYDKARTALEMAIRTHPAYAIAYENLGDIYAKLASQAYDKALQFDGGNATTQNKLALIRDLITTTGKTPVKQTASAPTPAIAAAPTPLPPTQPVAKPAPTATIIASTPGAAAPTASEIKPTPPAVVEAKPTQPVVSEVKTVAKPVVKDTASDDVAKALAAWAGAWSRKDMKAYFATYSSEFNTPKGVSRSNWEKERTQRIGARSGKISVTYDEPSISINGDRATVRFKQYYKARGMDSSSNKTLIFVRTGNKWLIKEENAR